MRAGEGEAVTERVGRIRAEQAAKQERIRAEWEAKQEREREGGRRFRAERVGRGLTQEQAARLVGVSAYTVGAWERYGLRPHPIVSDRVAVFLAGEHLDECGPETWDRPFDVQPLLVALGPDAPARLGTPAWQLSRWARSGLTVVQADQLASAVGLHPAEVWSTW